MKLWIFQLCSFLEWFWFFRLPCDSIWILGLACHLKKKPAGILIDCFESVYHFGVYCILTIAYLPLYKHRMSLYRSLISFNSVLYFLVYVSQLLFKCISKYFIILYATVNGIVALILFLNCSLLVYRNIIIVFIDLVSCNYAECIC